MSKLEVDAIEPQSGTTLTIGASGDSVNIASGATITDFTSTGIDDNATSTAITIDSSENVGIGTTSPSAKLHVDVSNSAVAPNGEADDFFVESSGNTGITIGSGISSRSSLYFANSTDNDIARIVVSHSEGSMRFTNNASERMRITSGGALCVNGTNANGPSIISSVSSVSGTACYANLNTAGAGSFYHYFINQANSAIIGSISNNGNTSTAFNTTSDYRLKENVSYDFDATTRLKQLKPARFNFIANANTTVDGFLAHEVQSIVPEAITGTKDATETKEKVVVNSNGQVIAENIEQADWENGKIADENGNTQYPTDSTWEATKVVPVYQGIDQSKLVPLLVKTIQELEARITALENN